MRVLLIGIAVCCVASSYTAMIKEDDSEVPDEACLIDYGITEPVDFSDRTKEFTNEQYYCIAACIYKKKNMMYSNGTVDKEAADSYLSTTDIVIQILFLDQYNNCKDRTHCQYFQCIVETLSDKLEAVFNPQGAIKPRLFSTTSIFKF